MLNIAFKEWKVVCAALASGQQSIILRKGGIAETNGIFEPEHRVFWLYPTQLHQQRDAIKPMFASLLTEDAAQAVPCPEIALQLTAEVVDIHYLTREDALPSLDVFHIWSREAVLKKFHYRTPGLYVMLVRIRALSQPVLVPFEPRYDGCKSWVELTQALPLNSLQPVLSDREFAERIENYYRAIDPCVRA